MDPLFPAARPIHFDPALPSNQKCDKVGTRTAVKLMANGILLAATQGDPLLRAYSTIIIDEAHERSLNIDFLLGYLKKFPEKDGISRSSSCRRRSTRKNSRNTSATRR